MESVKVLTKLIWVGDFFQNKIKNSVLNKKLRGIFF